MTNLTLRRNAFDPFELFRDFALPVQAWSGNSELPFAPDFEVKESKQAIVLRADLPGVKHDDLEVSVHNGTLTVSGKRLREEIKEGERYSMVERSYGAFTRAFTVPEGIDGTKLDAELKDGVLTLTLPRVPEAQPQKISVKVK